MLKLILNFSHLDFKNTYFRRSFILFEMITIYLTVLIYYYSSKAFVPNQEMNLNFYGADFFTYLLWGDLVLRIPQHLFYSPVRNIKRSIQENTFESMLLFTGNLKKVILGLSLMEISREIVSSLIMLIICILFFNFQISLASLVQAILLVFVSFPFFLGIGLLISSIVIWLEKGESLLYYLASVLAILAGVYFPVEVFPKVIQMIGAALSPFFLFLKYHRMILSGQSIPGSTFLIILVISTAIITISLIVIEWTIKQKRKQGTLFVT